MNFQDALFKLKELERNNINSIKTLGNRSSFNFKTDKNTFIITNSKKNSFVINEDFWVKVVNRYNKVPDNLKSETRQYTVSIWMLNNPSTVYSPYVAAILRMLSK